MKLPCTVFDVVEYTSDGVVATHNTLGCKDPRVRRIAKFPIVEAAVWVVRSPKVSFDIRIKCVRKQQWLSLTPHLIEAFVPRKTILEVGIYALKNVELIAPIEPDGIAHCVPNPAFFNRSKLTLDI